MEQVSPQRRGSNGNGMWTQSRSRSASHQESDDGLQNHYSSDARSGRGSSPEASPPGESKSEIRSRYVDELENWNPMEDDFRTGSTYTRGPGRDLQAVQKPVGPDVKGGNTFQLYVTGIPLAMTDEGLKNLFSRAGKVIKATKKRSKLPNSVDTYGFVHFRSISEIESAIRMLDNFHIASSVMRVSVALTKDEQQARKSQMRLQTLRIDSEEEDEDDFINNASSEADVGSTGGETGPKVKPEEEEGLDDLVESDTNTDPQDWVSTSLEHRETAPMRRETPMETTPSPEHESPRRTNTGRTQRTGNSIKPGDHEIRPVKNKICLKCGDTATKACTRCKGPYCSRKCQSEDWGKHKILCKTPVSDFEMNFMIDDDEIDNAIQEMVARQPVMWADFKKVSLTEPVTEVFPVVFRTPSDFSVLKASNVPTLTEMQADLNKQKCMSTAGKDSSDWIPQVGQVCIAEYKGEWSRAVPESVSGPVARVRYIDWGNTEVVNLTDMAALPADFKTLPAQAVNCSLPLQDPSGSNWTKSNLADFSSVMTLNVSHQCHLIGHDGDHTVVDLIQVEGNSNVAEDCISAGIAVRKMITSSACRSEPIRHNGTEKTVGEVAVTHPATTSVAARSSVQPSPKPVKSSSPVSTHTEGSLSSDDSLSTLHTLSYHKNKVDTGSIRKLQLKVGQEYQAEVVHFESGDDFFVQVRDEVQDNAFQQMHDNMQEHYKHLKAKSTFKFPKDGLLAVQSPSSELWHRAFLVDSNTRALSVFYMDYGNSEEVPFSNAHSLGCFRTVPQYAVNCQLDGARAGTVDEDSIYNDIVGRKLRIKVCGREGDKYTIVVINSKRALSPKDSLAQLSSPSKGLEAATVATSRVDEEASLDQDSENGPDEDLDTKIDLNVSPLGNLRRSEDQDSENGPNEDWGTKIDLNDSPLGNLGRSEEVRSSSVCATPSASNEDQLSMKTEKPLRSSGFRESSVPPDVVMASSLEQCTLTESPYFYDVRVLEAASFDNILLLDESGTEDYDNYLDTVASHLSHYEGPYPPRRLGELVYVQTGGCWLRGEVLNMLTTEAVLVKLLDEGKDQAVSVDQLAPVDSFLEQPPVQVMHGRLYNIAGQSEGVSWEEDIQPLICCGKPVKAIVKGVKGRCHEIELYEHSGEQLVCLNVELIRMGKLSQSRMKATAVASSASRPKRVSGSRGQSPAQVLARMVNCLKDSRPEGAGTGMSNEDTPTTTSTRRTNGDGSPTRADDAPQPDTLSPVGAGRGNLSPGQTSSRKHIGIQDRETPTKRNVATGGDVVASASVTSTDVAPCHSSITPGPTLSSHAVRVQGEEAPKPKVGAAGDGGLASPADASTSVAQVTTQPCDERHRVVVCHVEGPDSFYCHWQNEDDRIKAVEDERIFNDEYTKRVHDIPRLERRPVVGDLIALYSDADARWCRVRVVQTNVKGSGKLEVQEVIQGTKSVVPVSKVRELLGKFKAIPRRVLTCIFGPSVTAAERAAAQRVLVPHLCCTIHVTGLRTDGKCVVSGVLDSGTGVSLLAS